MFRRLTPSITVNMKQIASIELVKKDIIYTQATHAWGFFLGVGGSDKVTLKVTYSSELEAAAAYEALCGDIAPPKEKPLA
jgi:hypothetical protein